MKDELLIWTKYINENDHVNDLVAFAFYERIIFSRICTRKDVKLKDKAMYFLKKMVYPFSGSNRVSALAEELFAGGSSAGLGSSRSGKADCTDDSSARSSVFNPESRQKKSSIGKKIKTPAKKVDVVALIKGIKMTPAKKAAIMKKTPKKSREMTYVDQSNILQTKRRRKKIW